MPVYKVTVEIVDQFYYQADNEVEAIKYCRANGQHWLLCESRFVANEAVMAKASMTAELADEDEVDPDLICLAKE